MIMRRSKNVAALVAGGLALAGSGILLLMRAKGSKMTGPKPKYDAAQLVPTPGKAVTAQRIRALGDLLDAVWPDVTGNGPMPPQAKEVALAQAAAEFTGYGQGWDGDMAGSNNVASYQCFEHQQQGTPYYKCVSHKDSKPTPQGQKEFTTTFRYYTDGMTPDGKQRSAAEAGAWDFLQSIAIHPFPAPDELLSGDVLAYARKQYGQRYFGGFNLSSVGQAAYASTIAKLVKDGVPIRMAGETPEMVAGRIALYAGSMGRALPEIAAALGHDRVYASVPADVFVFHPNYEASGKPIA